MNDATVLEWLTAIGAIATPLVAAVIAVWFSRRHARSEALTQSRLALFRELSPLLNRLFGYFGFIGRWKESSPLDVVETKRRCDDVFFASAPLFSDAARAAYMRFMNECFDTRTPLGEDPLLRTTAQLRRDVHGGWDPAWESRFALDVPAERARAGATSIRAAYSALMAALVRDIEIGDTRRDYLSRRVGTGDAPTERPGASVTAGTAGTARDTVSA